jgi:hypothetical protein
MTMNITKTAIAAATLAFALTTGAMAQTPPATTAPSKVEAPKTAPPSSPSTATTAKPAKAAKAAKTPAKPRTDVSMACSKELDAKNVHGKERSKQMKTCKAAGAKTDAAKKN